MDVYVWLSVCCAVRLWKCSRRLLSRRPSGHQTVWIKQNPQQCGEEYSMAVDSDDWGIKCLSWCYQPSLHPLVCLYVHCLYRKRLWLHLLSPRLWKEITNTSVNSATKNATHIKWDNFAIFVFLPLSPPNSLTIEASVNGVRVISVGVKVSEVSIFADSAVKEIRLWLLYNAQD